MRCFSRSPKFQNLRIEDIPEVYDLDAVGDVRLDVNAEPVDAVDGFLQFVGARLLLRVFQALGAERAQQQSKKQIEHLSITDVTSPPIYSLTISTT